MLLRGCRRRETRSARNEDGETSRWAPGNYELGVFRLRSVFGIGGLFVVDGRCSVVPRRRSSADVFRARAPRPRLASSQ
jgi:hypothetical protein